MRKILQITGLDCVNCARELEEIIAKTEGVKSVSLAFVTQKLTLEYDGEETLERIISIINSFEKAHVLEENAQTILRIENLDCPVCAEALQGDIAKIKGVEFVSVDYVTQTITLRVANETVVEKVIKVANAFEQVRVLDGGRYAPKGESHAKEWWRIGISAVLFILGLVFEKWINGTWADVLTYVFYVVAYLTVGYPVLISTLKNIVKGRIFDENFLMTLASIGAVALGEYSEAVLVMLLYQLGELLQAIAVGSSRASVAELMALKSERATRLIDGKQEEVSPEQLSLGDIVLVKAGEKSATDGVLLSDIAVLDTKSLTGEAELRTVKKGEEILSGCINAGGVYEMRVTRLYQDSAVGRILDMVENASAGKAAPEKFITKFAKYYTPIVCVLALLLAVVAPLLSGWFADGYLYFKDVARWVRSALTFLVVSCPCALIISVPLTYFSGIGTCAKNGILMKGAIYLDALARAQIFAFDKTGTLTEGNFTVCATYPENAVSEIELLSVAAAVEREASHPIAKAFSMVQTAYHASNVKEVAGLGICAEINGESVLVGNAKLLEENEIPFPDIESAYTLIFVAKKGKYMGAIEVGDKIREDSKLALNALFALGIEYSVMLTGDNVARAQKIGEELGIQEINAQLLPDEKLKKAEELKAQGGLVYVGDGINDAPVMITADCAVSMGKLGSAAAIEASDVVLIHDDLSALPTAVKVARKTRRIVTENIIFSIAMKTAFMLLGAFGVLPLSLAVFADVGVMLLAVLNSFRVRKIK